MRPVITVVDYGRSNLLSVRRALEYCGADVGFAADPGDIQRARALVLPGVGAFADGMAQLYRRGLVEPLLQKAGEGAPLLGICLGMQMLQDSSIEGGFHKGLGLVEGTVELLPDKTTDGTALKVPHIGWNAITLEPGAEQGLFKNTQNGDEVYFVHSFQALPRRSEDCAATVEYGGYTICAAVRRNNVAGLQFHPEKSGPAGLAILQAFVEELRNAGKG